MDAKSNLLNWLEIPVLDMDRAKKFYGDIFNIEMPEMEMGGALMAFFPAEENSGKVSGALCKSEWHKPGQDGVVVYLNGNPDLAEALNKVTSAGGTIIIPKTVITPEIGYFAMFLDSEGNKIALHSGK